MNTNKINILFMYVCCFKYREKWEKIKILNKGLNIPFIILCGKNMNNDFELLDNILYLNCSDNYEGLPEKVICGLSAIIKIPEFSNITHIIKIDDDNTCNPLNVINKLKNEGSDIINSYDYIGQLVHNENHIENVIFNEKARQLYKYPDPRKWHFGKVNEDSYWYNKRYDGNYVPWADGGCSYILSKKAAELITSEYNFSNLINIRKEAIYEDIFIAIILRKHDILPYKYDFLINGDKV